MDSKQNEVCETENARNVSVAHVTMHVVSRKTTYELKTDRSIKRIVDAALRDIMQPILSGDKLAEILSIPSGIDIQWNVELVAFKKGFHVDNGDIPIMVSIWGVPSLMEKLHGAMMEEATSQLFKEINGQSDASREVATALGYDVNKAAKFRVFLPDQVQALTPIPADLGDCDCDCDCDCSPVWAEGGWAKGCSSWPW
jgi:hypothetical protein